MKQRLKLVELVLDIYGACAKTPVTADYAEKITELLKEIHFYCDQSGISPSHVLTAARDRYNAGLVKEGLKDGGPGAGPQQAGGSDRLDQGSGGRAVPDQGSAPMQEP